MIHSEGIFRLWRGVTAMFAGCIPGKSKLESKLAFDVTDVSPFKIAHAAYFSIFESMKVALRANSKDEHQPLRAALCGAIATTSHDFFMNPFDMIKQRMQLGYYRSISHCISTIAKNEGILSFYVSFPTTLLMNIPYGAIVVAVNESAKKVLNPSGQYNLSASLLAGSIAGGVAAAFTTPLDVIKTRIQTQEMIPCIDRSTVLNNNLGVAGCIEKRTYAPSSSSTSASASGVNPGVGGMPLNQAPRANFYTSATSTHDPFMRVEGRPRVNGLGFLTEGYSAFIGVTKRLIKEEGLMGFWRGVVPRVMTQAPAVAISWTAYESVKATFGWQLGFMSREKREK
jgi:solute carrier family 25 iron transporter 28/37